MEVEQKIEEMQKYIPCLKLLIENLEKNPAKAEQVKKMQYLLEMLSKKDSSIKLETLVRCEGILQKIYGKEQILSSSVENEGKKNGTETQNVSKSVEPLISQTNVKPNQSKLLNGNSTETVVVVEIQTDSNIVKVSETQKKIVVENDEDKGGGHRVGAATVGSTVGTLDPLHTPPAGSKSVPFVEINKDHAIIKAKEDQAVAKIRQSVIVSYQVKKTIKDETQSVNAIQTFKDTSFNSSQVKDIDLNTNSLIRCIGENVSNKIDDEPAVANEPIIGGNDGECDMDIDEELTNSVGSERLIANQLSVSPNQKDGRLNEMTAATAVGSKQETSTHSKTATSTSSANSNIVDLTSDDSNEGMPATPPIATKTPTVSSAPRALNQVEKIRLQPSKPSEKPAVVYLIKNNSNSSITKVPNITQPANTYTKPLNSNQPANTNTKPLNSNQPANTNTKPLNSNQPANTNTKPLNSNQPANTNTKPLNANQPAEKAQEVDKTSNDKSKGEPKNIMTIDLLDSDSDDEGKSNSERKSSDPASNVQMPAPKVLSKPMFTIASVQSISTLQQHQERRREIEKELYGIVKSIQFTTHHTVPQKYNTAVRNYLERFIKDLMFEKNRVNLCLQKLLKTLDTEKYKQVKKIIQTYCSEPANDPNLPEPSPYCHRIKVYPEKLQFVMRQMFFFNMEISVIGYKVYSLVHFPQGLNGKVTPSGVSSPVDAKRTPQSPHKSPTTSGIRLTNQKPQIGQKLNNPSAGRTFPKLPTASSSDGNLLAPMKSEAMTSSNKSARKAKRRKHVSDDDDDDYDDDDDDDDDGDENYVPQGNLSESDEDTETPTETRRRTSLQRASKLRCQKYLELERAIDDETYIPLATLAKSLKGDVKPKSSSSTSGNQPPVKKYRPASALKKKKKPQSEDEDDGKDSQDDETKEREQDDKDEVELPAKRQRKSDSNISHKKQDMEQDEADDEDNEPAPVLDLTVENRAKNVTRAYHCRSKYIDRCVICHEKVNRKCSVSHYVSCHRDREVYISRFPKSDILKLQSETMCFAFPSANSRCSAYVAYCIFCQQEQCLSMRNWYEHYTRHTGEYIYECSKCKARRSTRQQINRHVNNECSAKGCEAVVLKEVDPETIRIDACVCLLCNYVQLDFERLIKHLQSQHEFPGTVHELPEGTYQLMNLLRIEQNHYEGKQYDEGVGLQSKTRESVVPEDDMSFMICNMLASSSDQAMNDPLVSGELANNLDVIGRAACDPLVGADTRSQPAALEQAICDPLVSDQMTIEQVVTQDENTSGEIRVETQTVECVGGSLDPVKNRSMQSPEMIIRECITTIEKLEADSSVNLKENAIQDSLDDKLISSEKSTKKNNEEHTKDDAEITDKTDCMVYEQESEHSMEALQMDDSSECEEEETECTTTISFKETSQERNSMEEKKDAAPIKIKESVDDGSKHSVDLANRTTTSDSIVVEKDPLDTNTNVETEHKSLLFELSSMDDLTKSATENIFQRVSDSLINSVYESIEVATTLSESTSELPDTNTISSENTMDSMSSGPQFLQSTELTVDPVVMSIHETIVPDLDDVNIVGPMEMVEKKGEESQECIEAQEGPDDETSRVGNNDETEKSQHNLVEPEPMEDLVEPMEDLLEPIDDDCEMDEMIVPEPCDEIRNVVSEILNELANKDLSNSAMNDKSVDEAKEMAQNDEQIEEPMETDEPILEADNEEHQRKINDIQSELELSCESDVRRVETANKTHLEPDQIGETQTTLEGVNVPTTSEIVETVLTLEENVESKSAVEQTSEKKETEEGTNDKQQSVKTTDEALSGSLPNSSAVVDDVAEPTTNESLALEAGKENEESST